eukprot:1395053-Amphidinium_carterae.1
MKLPLMQPIGNIGGQGLAFVGQSPFQDKRHGSHDVLAIAIRINSGKVMFHAFGRDCNGQSKLFKCFTCAAVRPEDHH